MIFLPLFISKCTRTKIPVEKATYDSCLTLIFVLIFWLAWRAWMERKEKAGKRNAIMLEIPLDRSSCNMIRNTTKFDPALPRPRPTSTVERIGKGRAYITRPAIPAMPTQTTEKPCRHQGSEGKSAGTRNDPPDPWCPPAHPPIRSSVRSAI
ncbi:hypothetical protein BDP81DRAFT_176531 [Colletotrichum phormii]|uniref:Uncharacterized protein n=1 Tax=Colletotrichum phormii TaxID=359342 RepID=A0AAI9ZYX0_9PEZI|nr:uncharacterized protein BDP81DRAFT_176531 [Colletotrichum phormii]KAK1639389.1 hypothetical protein BDP81DRAFT_176531 [Colletotrichum phormii]